MTVNIYEKGTRLIQISTLIEILEDIQENHEGDAWICPDNAAGLAVFNKNDRQIGHIDFNNDEFVTSDD